ncbi:MAG TPA: hypothetical protein VNE21_00435, partial [Mycobacteriales bacterium]|nr:hypothetical protein [Mycobacteriales bacterium]
MPRLPETRAYSPASLAKATLRAIGVVPVLERDPADVGPAIDRAYLGRCTAALFGGRAEAHIRRVPVPVRLVDLTSAYPTVNALLGHWPLVTAHHLDVQDATAAVRGLLPLATPDAVLDPALWRAMGCTVVEVAPHGDRLPVRARFGRDGSTWTVGVVPVWSDRPAFYMLPDVVASVLLTGQVPEVRQAWQLVGTGRMPGLRPYAIRGTVRVDPYGDDLFQRVAEERQRVKRGRPPYTMMPDAERAWLARGLKCLANSGSYGVLVEANPRELPGSERHPVTVHADRPPFTAAVTAPEEPGAFAFPPIGANVPAGTRLLLALWERLVTDAAGTWAMCDTDSLAIVACRVGGLVPCPGGPTRLPSGRSAIRALAHEEVEAIRARFTALSPYDPAVVPSLLGYDDQAHGRDPEVPREAEVLVIAAKRYACFERDGADVRMTKVSEHGLGHLVNPTDPDSEDRGWMRLVWERIVREAVGLPVPPLPAWADRMAVSRIALTTPHLMTAFADFNRRRPPARRLRPFTFGLTASVAPLGWPTGVDPRRFRPVAPFETDPRKWPRLPWRNVHATHRTDPAEAMAGAERRDADRIALATWAQFRDAVLAEGGIRLDRDYPAADLPRALVRRGGNAQPLDELAGPCGFERADDLLAALRVAEAGARDARRGVGHRREDRPAVEVDPPGMHFPAVLDPGSESREVDAFTAVTIRAAVAGHPWQPEVKAVGAEGCPCDRRTVGLLGPRPVVVRRVHVIGKEAHRLEERAVGLVGDPRDVVTELQDVAESRCTWDEVLRPVLGRVPVAVVAAETGVQARRV